MPDLTMFCPIFSWRKHFKIPPARILQSHVLDSKVGNAFSAPSLRDVLLLLNNFAVRFFVEHFDIEVLRYGLVLSSIGNLR